MLTGDNPRTAEAVARKLGIADLQAGAKPHDKHQKVKSIKAAGRIVGMAGDSINDAPGMNVPCGTLAHAREFEQPGVDCTWRGLLI
jgi:cation transport ATPase